MIDHTTWQCKVAVRHVRPTETSIDLMKKGLRNQWLPAQMGIMPCYLHIN